jgi:hypothetical protein
MQLTCECRPSACARAALAPCRPAARRCRPPQTTSWRTRRRPQGAGTARAWRDQVMAMGRGSHLTRPLEVLAAIFPISALRPSPGTFTLLLSLSDKSAYGKPADGRGVSRVRAGAGLTGNLPPIPNQVSPRARASCYRRLTPPPPCAIRHRPPGRCGPHFRGLSRSQPLVGHR